MGITLSWPFWHSYLFPPKQSLKQSILFSPLFLFSFLDKTNNNEVIIKWKNRVKFDTKDPNLSLTKIQCRIFKFTQPNLSPNKPNSNFTFSRVGSCGSSNSVSLITQRIQSLNWLGMDHLARHEPRPDPFHPLLIHTLLSSSVNPQINKNSTHPVIPSPKSQIVLFYLILKSSLWNQGHSPVNSQNSFQNFK